MLVKICGLKDRINIEQVLSHKPEMAGFIFYEKSPRFVGYEPLFTQFVYGLHNVKKVGVFVNTSFDQLLETSKAFGLDYVQLHGNESADDCNTISRQISVIKAFRMDEDFNFKILAEYEGCCSYFLFDTNTSNYGGSGKKFNWKLLENYKGSTPFILSGGIGPEDNEQLKQIIHPAFAGIDLNSRFEIEPGIKNIDLIKKFIHEIRN